MTTNLTIMRTATAAAIALLALVLFPAAGLAQVTGCDTDATGPSDALYPPARANVLIGATVVTPNATIEISGDDWGCETTIQIVVTEDDGSRTSLGTAEVLADGTFTTTVIFPEDVSDITAVEVQGTDGRGETRTTTSTLDAQTLAAPTATLDVLQPTGAGTDTTPYILGGAVLAILFASGGLVVWRRRTV